MVNVGSFEKLAVKQLTGMSVALLLLSLSFILGCGEDPTQFGMGELQRRRDVRIDVKKTVFSSQDLVIYLNGYFPVVRLNPGDRVFRCAVEGEERSIQFPAFFARSE